MKNSDDDGDSTGNTVFWKAGLQHASRALGVYVCVEGGRSVQLRVRGDSSGPSVDIYKT